MKPSSGPQATNIGNIEFSSSSTTSLSGCGQPSGGPSGEPDQSCARISAPTLPPPSGYVLPRLLAVFPKLALKRNDIGGRRPARLVHHKNTRPSPGLRHHRRPLP